MKPLQFIASIVACAIMLMIVLGTPTSAQQTPQQVDVAALPFSSARQAGPTLYVSGQIPVKPDGTTVTGDVAAQTRQTMDNIAAVLKEHGYTFADVVNVTVYLSDMKHYQAMNAVYREYFPNGKFPARACVGGLQLAFGANLEISAIAFK